MRIFITGLIISFAVCILIFSLNAETVYFVPKSDITGMVDLSYANLIKRTVKQAEKAGASALIIELNTPGGRVDAALRITDILLSTKLLTVVFINQNAISAGALISLASEKIFMALGGVIGATTPVYTKAGKMETASEKMVSVMRAAMRSCAEKYKRPARIAEAMVDSDIELTKSRDGIDLADGKLLTLTAKEALKLKIADYLANDLKEVLKILKLENATIIESAPTAQDKAISFLGHPILSGILMTLGILGLFFEVKTPGWGVGGTIGILCLALFFVTQIMAGYADWGAIALFIIGLILIMVEFFIIPGFGIVGISGILAILGSFIMWYSTWSKYFQSAPYIMLGVVLLSGISIYFMFKFLPRTRLFNRLVLDTSEIKKSGYHASSDKIMNLEGKKGTALTTLRPAGSAEIDGEKMDVMSDSEFIKKGEKIIVIKVEGNRVLVKKI